MCAALGGNSSEFTVGMKKARTGSVTRSSELVVCAVAISGWEGRQVYPRRPPGSIVLAQASVRAIGWVDAELILQVMRLTDDKEEKRKLIW